ncbi:MAG TPA: helix-turn-helix domain-containing protein [Candidatus Brocadiia bacterium]|nr:helix-turn-helix domain-containing protein [Candidatus Brocadiales bacterium]
MGNNDKDPYIISSTLTEQLTANFYLWEKRGRGWQAWDYPVELEPAYEPFLLHTSPTSQPVADDGRKPGLFEKLWKGLKKSQKLDDSSLQSEPSFDLKPRPFTDKSGLREISISLPPQQKVNVENAEQFLMNLSHCSFPLSFEIIGTSDSIRVQLSCREADFLQVKQQLQAYFPDAVINEENDVLKSLWDEEQEIAIVDFGLSQEFMRPLRTFRNLETDPLIGIVGALENLDEGEIGLVQVLFQAVRNPWSESILRSVVDWEGRSFFSDAPEMIPLAKEKTRKPLFAAVIRIAGMSPLSYRAWEIVRVLGSGLTQVANPQSNELIPLTNEDYDDFDHEGDVLLRQTHRSGMLLNAEELVSLVHPPSVSVRSQKLIRELKKTKAVPSIALDHQFVLGENLHQGKETLVTLSPEQRLRHTYVIGATGTGKSTLLLNMIIQDINNGLGTAVLDPHGDLIDRVLGYIPEERFEDVIFFDPSDADYPVGLNILSAHSEIEKNVLSSDLVAVFRRLSTSWGDQMTSVLGNAILAFLESKVGGTLIDLRRFLIESEFRKSFLETVQDPDVIYYWQKGFPLLRGNPQASIITRLDTFLRPKLIRNMAAQKEGLNFQDIIDNRKIFLVKLSQGLIGEENASLLGALIVSKLQQVATARQAKSESERAHFYLYVDEFQNFITPSMSAILSGARKYHLGLVLAHQELRQLWNQDTEVANSVISNPCTRICFRLGDFDAKKLEDGFSAFDAQDLQNLGVGEAICRIERNEYDFNLRTFPLPDVDQNLTRQRRNHLITLSREKYAAKREEVEKIVEESLRPALSSAETLLTPRQRIQKEKSEKMVGVSDDKVLSTDERGFLEFLSQHPDMFITQFYKALDLSGYKGDRLKESLVEKGFITQEETREGKGGRLAKVLALTDKGTSVLKDVSLTGKGGDLHKHLQLMFKEQAQLYGWKAKIEEKIPGSLESVDVGLTKNDVRVAIEISTTTKTEQEMQNIRKCLEAGYDYIICVSSEEKRLFSLKTEARKYFTIKERERIRFYLPSKVKDFLPSVSQAGNVSEKGVVSEEISKQKQLLDTKEAAELLGISRNTLYEWVVQKKVPFIKVGRLTKFRLEDLEAWLRHRTQQEERVNFLE